MATAQATRRGLQSDGDRDLRAKLMADHAVRTAIERLKQEGEGESARRQLLATAIRLTVEMTPELHEIIDNCRATLGVEGPFELFVYPDPHFNAAAVRPEKGRLMLMMSSALLEGFETDELRFIAGHEVGHYLFDHHAIPTGALLAGGARLGPQLTLALFSWQRYAEISADRAGLVCAGSLEPAARALFKLASGLSGDRVRVRIDQFLAQVGDLRRETEWDASAGRTAPRDWFATHPFNPLRLKAAQLCAASELMRPGGLSRDALEVKVQELMTLMDPSYLSEPSEEAEAMRRLLFAAGIAIANATGSVAPEAMAELERLLGAVPLGLKPEAVLADLPSRIENVRKRVAPLRRAQVIRDLCLIARADGHMSEAEVNVIRDIAVRVDVDPALVTCALDPSCSECGCGCRGRREPGRC